MTRQTPAAAKMPADLMTQVAKFYRIEVSGTGPFRGTVLHKGSGHRLTFPAQYTTDSAAILAARAFLTGAIKRGELPLA